MVVCMWRVLYYGQDYTWIARNSTLYNQTEVFFSILPGCETKYYSIAFEVHFLLDLGYS